MSNFTQIVLAGVVTGVIVAVVVPYIKKPKPAQKPGILA